MDSNDAKNMLGILAELMDEQSEHTDQAAHSLTLYNNIRQEINTELAAAVEQISFGKKYAVIDAANALTDAIGLYINYPELVDKYVIGFYGLDEAQVKSICSHYLESASEFMDFSQKNPGMLSQLDGLSDTIPTIFANGEEHGQIRALNLAEKSVFLSKENYVRLEPGKEQAIELAGVLSSYYLSSPAVLEHQAILVLPGEMDRRQAYHRVLFQAMDALVVQNSMVDEQIIDLLHSGNVKLILIIGKCSKEQELLLAQLTDDMEIERINAASMADAYKALQEPARNMATNNSANKMLMESCLCSILWHLAEQKEILTGRIAQINQDLLGDDPNLSKHIKNLQERVGDQIRNLDKCAETYYGSMQNILKWVEELQQLCGWQASDTVNRHVVMHIRLLELLAAECAFFKYYKKSNSNDHIRIIESLYEQAGGHPAIARVLINDYYSRQQTPADLKEFAQYKTKSSLLMKKKLAMYQALNLSMADCIDIIHDLTLPLSPLEYRLMGTAQLEQGNPEEAKANFQQALMGGDLEAGEWLLSMCENNTELTFLADNGVAGAAYQCGNNIYQQEYQQTHNATLLNKAMKYLHIAAAREHPQALELLGDIWFERAMAGESRKSSLKIALRYYTAPQRNKKQKKITLERMGIIYFEQADYQSAKQCLETAKTAQAFFLLGQMYEQGKGLAANKEQALNYYESAMNEGHSQAQVEYHRLYQEIEKEKAKVTIDSNTSYYSSSYYSGYYTSYYSGW